jgi:SAM-dependent methyltransferase
MDETFEKYETLSNAGVTAERLEQQAEGEDLQVYMDAIDASDRDDLLEVGCGSGALSRLLAREPTAHVTGIDLGADRILFCRDTAQKCGLTNTRYEAADLRDYCVDHEDKFSAVLCRYVLMYALPDSACVEFVQAMAQCVRPGGSLYAFEADISIGRNFYPPLRHDVLSALDLVGDFYRKKLRIEWRRGVTLAHIFDLAGLRQPDIRLITGRIINRGRPRALIDHDSRDLEALIAPALVAGGRESETARVARIWRQAMFSETSFSYTPVFLGKWTKLAGGAI